MVSSNTVPLLVKSQENYPVLAVLRIFESFQGVLWRKKWLAKFNLSIE